MEVFSYLSKGGKLTLIHSTLSSLPTYQLSVFKAPIGICKSIEKSWRNFLWKNHGDDKITHLLRWNKITITKENGGLGIYKVADTNFSLLCKWLWRFHVEHNSLWKRIILAKYSQSFIEEILTLA